MQKIQRFPAGYLGITGNTSSGMTPGGIADAMVPTLEMARFFDAESQTRYFVNAVAAGVPQLPLGATSFGWPTADVLPTGKTMFIYGIGFIGATVAAAESIEIQLMAYYQGSGAVQFQKQEPFSAGEAVCIGGFLDTPVVLRSGDSLGVYVSSRTGVTAFGTRTLSVVASIY